MHKWDGVDLFCPHPFLRKRSSSQATFATGKADDSELPCGLLSTTAFRSFEPQNQPSAHQFRSLVLSLLRLWQQVRPQDVPRYAVTLRPIVSQILGMYLRNEFELNMDELVQIRELGRAVVKHCRTLDDVGAVAGRSIETDIGIGNRVAIGDVGFQISPMGAATVPATGRSGYASGGASHAWLRGFLGV
ncbi:unnamed protein product [Rhizoctonia solani]|uniref:Uncharacterized protein n=1 Tax=Rhizoctonia solani TaxID=456999 RepID=A0A8H3H0D1_9AGAM|nr:unnamed protein product [Rhizoctonia solani]